MNICSELVEVDSDVREEKTVNSSVSVFVEALFFIWVGLFASLTFLATLILTITGMLGFIYALYIYAGISIVTLLLAFLLYFARGKQNYSETG